MVKLAELIERSSNSFGDLILRIYYDGKFYTLTFDEGSWPEISQVLTNPRRYI